MPLYRRPRIIVQDEGTEQGRAGIFNFVGTAVGATVSSDLATVTITGGGGGGSPGGNTGEVQYNSSGSFAGIAMVKSDGQYLMLVSSSLEDFPSVPDPGRIKLFDRDLAGRQMLSVREPSGMVIPLQPMLSSKKIGIWTHPGNSNVAMSAWGLTTPSTSGTLTARTVSATNVATMARRLGVVSAAAAGSVSAVFSAQTQFTMASGFTVVFRFFNSDAAAVSTAKVWVGMTAQNTAFTGSGANPSSFNNAWGVGADTNQAELAVMARGATTATVIGLGPNFPANTRNIDYYEVALFCPPSGTAIGWRVERINTGHVAAGFITTDLPSSTQLLAPQLWRGNGSSATAVALDVVSVYMETNN
jgi:hypothetical protein